VIDAQSLLDTFGLSCWRCRKPDPDAFEDLAVLEQLLMARRPMTSRVEIMEPFGIGTARRADVELGKPVHARCRPGNSIYRTIGF
jgi:hypothetical protein